MSAPEESDDVTIDFHSAEFNRVDDLNDCAGNYRSFETLDGVVTVHERHQREIFRRKDVLGPPPDGEAYPERCKENAEAESLETGASLAVISEGRTLIIDTDPERAMACGRTLLAHRLPCTVIVTGSTLASAPSPKSCKIRCFHADSVLVTGVFTGFSAKVTVGESEKTLAECLDTAAVFDLVLDLQPAVSFRGGRLPIGYYAPGRNPVALNQVMAELPEMRGQFKKPQFVAFYKDRCFHGRSRTHDCSRCLEICPISAIRTVDRNITIDHSLCQGCGGCALVCPADAIGLVHPSRDELFKSLQSSLERGSLQGVSPKHLLISDSALAVSGFPETDGHDREHWSCLAVREIAYVRLELILSALAWGAKEVLVGCNSQNPPAVREAVEWQVQMGRAIVQGLRLGEERIRFLIMSPEDIDLTKGVPRPACSVKQANASPAAPTIFSPVGDRRALVYLAAQYLHDQSGIEQAWLPLPMGSPFGTVVVNSDACTLCMTCVAACPSGALSSGGKAPSLLFQESQCHQCGLCREMCPEAAIELVPRLLLDQGAVEGQTVLRETIPFCCIECGTPFATSAMIDRIREKLTGHWMYINERQLRRLQMCRTCRTRDALVSQEMGSWTP